jgi:hypothetical protein
MLKTNEKFLVEFLLQVTPGHPVARPSWQVSHEGKPFILPGIGGITSNIQVGDSAFGLLGDHIECGVSCAANPDNRHAHPNSSVQLLANVGDTATIVSGDAKGKKGVVIGHHGGSEHLVVDFPKTVKDKLSYDDQIIIKSKGMGLKLVDHPEISLFNVNPTLLKKLKIKELKNGKLQIPVTTIVPANCMGSGIGASNVASGDYDIMTSDKASVKKYKLDKIRFGDIVALSDHDNSFGRGFKKGAISIGVVIHSDCLKAGHGPGVVTLLTCSKSLIEPVLNSKANLADILKIGTFKK